MPSIESILTRELDLRFIDARTIATEARITLGIEGYPSKEHVQMIRDEAVRIFKSKSDEEQTSMQRRHWDLEAIKIPSGSVSLSECMDSASDHQSITSDVSRTSSRKSLIRGIFRR